jgi:hypothetical protein
MDVVTDPIDVTQNTWYSSVYSGWGGPPNGLGGLYMTTNRGLTWTKLTGSQFDRVTSMTFNPANNNQAYLTTETQGLWMTDNIHAQAPVWTLVASYPFRQPERVFFNPYNQNEMWVTSFGNGMRVGYLNPIGIDEHRLAKSIVHLFPNPVHDLLHLSSVENEPKPVSVNIYDLTGQLLMSEKVSENSVDVTSLKPGVYIIEFVIDNKSKEFRRIIKL